MAIKSIYIRAISKYFKGLPQYYIFKDERGVWYGLPLNVLKVVVGLYFNI